MISGTNTPLIFFGTEDFSVAALTGLIEAGYDIRAVVTKPDTPRGRGHKLSSPAVKVVAEQHNIPVWQPAKLSDLIASIKALQPIAGVLVSYGKIIPQSIIELFTPGIINLHPSLLPKYRGPTPIESAIANGDPMTGVSIMQLAPAMDVGPVYAARSVSLSGTETKPELYHTLATIGVDTLLETLPAILHANLKPTAQDDDQATYCNLLHSSNGLLDPSLLTTIEAERRVRAYLGFPKSKLTILGHPIIITKAHVSSQPKTPLDIKCRDGAYLTIDELIAPSGRRMDSGAFLRGYAV